MNHLCNKLESVKIENNDVNEKNTLEKPPNICNSEKNDWKFNPNRIYILLLNNLTSWEMIGIFNSLNELYYNSGEIMLILPEKYEICLIYSNIHKIIKYRITPDYSYNVLLHTRKTCNKNLMNILFKHENLKNIEKIEIFNYLNEYTKLINISYDIHNLCLYEINGNKIIIDNTKISGHILYNLRTINKIQLNKVCNFDN
jgi:hypothetical protein